MLALRRGNILPFRAMVDGKYVLSSFFLSIQFILVLLILCNVVLLFVCNCCWFQLPRTLTSLFYLNLFVSRIMYWELYPSVTPTCYLEVIDVIAKNSFEPERRLNLNTSKLLHSCKLDDTIQNLIQSDSIYFIHTIQFTISFIWKRREKYYSNGKTFFNICLHLISLKKFAVNKSILKHSSFSEKFTHKKINESRDLNVFFIYIQFIHTFIPAEIFIFL